jgi:hypothetical protein
MQSWTAKVHLATWVLVVLALMACPAGAHFFKARNNVHQRVAGGKVGYQPHHEHPLDAHTKHKHEFAKLQEKLKGHFSKGAAAWAGHIPTHLAHHFAGDNNKQGDL